MLSILITKDSSQDSDLFHTVSANNVTVEIANYKQTIASNITEINIWGARVNIRIATTGLRRQLKLAKILS